MLFISLLSGTIAIDYYLWFNKIGVINYAGLSDVLNMLLVLVLFQQLQRNKHCHGLAGITTSSLVRIYYRHFNCTDNIPGKEAIC